MASVDEYGYITLDENTRTLPNSRSASSSSTDSHSSVCRRPRSGVMAKPGMFWFLTIAITLGIQSLIHSIWGTTIVGEVFGYSYGSGINSWGTNLAIAVGPWGFAVCGLIGTLIYNTIMCNKAKLYGYSWYHYLLSLLMSLACSFAWILIVWIISVVIVVIVVAIVIAIICNILSEL